MLPVSTDWRIPPDASAPMAAAAPGSGRTRPGPAPAAPSAPSVPSAQARASAARNLSTSVRGTPASASVSPAMARSVRPALGATSSSSRPNISRNTASYSRVPSPSALSKV
jgi:hypothetical protein